MSGRWDILKIRNFNSENLNVERCIKIVVTQDFIIVTDQISDMYSRVL